MIYLQENWRDGEAWDDFVDRHDESRFCHLFRYASVVECYGYEPRNLCFLNDDTIVGVLPAVEVRSLFFGRKLVSQPFSEYGGLLLDPALKDEEVTRILCLLRAYRDTRLGAGSIEMHGNHGISEKWRGHQMVVSALQHIALLWLDRPVDELWNSSVRYSVRKAVKQARGHGLDVTIECDENIIQERFFPLYLKSMHRLGVPPHKIDYYLNCYHRFGDRMILFWARKGNSDVAALLGFSCAGRVSIINTVSDPEQWHLRPNDLLHWEFLKWATETGHRLFDFGNVRYDGQMTFKKKWGCEFYEHKHYVIVGDNVAEQARTFDSSAGSMQMMASLWSRYMPLSVAKRIGPMIRKHLVR
jgi:hypothetical protein